MEFGFTALTIWSGFSSGKW